MIAAPALLIPAGGCSDGLTEGGAATDGDIVTFSATVAPMTGDTQTRATVDGTFEEGNTIGVISKGDTKAKTYVYRSGQFVPATDADAIRWQGTANEQKNPHRLVSQREDGRIHRPIRRPKLRREFCRRRLSWCRGNHDNTYADEPSIRTSL